MAAAVCYRKRAATPFLLNEVVPAPPHLAKRARFSPCPAVAAQRPPPLETCFAASGHDVRQRQASEREAAAARVANASSMEECAGIMVEQMSAAADVADARSRASSILKLIEGAIANRSAASAEEQAAALQRENAALREENAALRALAEALERDNGVLTRGVATQHRRQEELERDNGVLKRGVAVLHRRQEEAERAAEEMKKKVAELVAANHALGVRASGADSCRFQVFRGPDVF